MSGTFVTKGNQNIEKTALTEERNFDWFSRKLGEVFGLSKGQSPSTTGDGASINDLFRNIPKEHLDLYLYWRRSVENHSNAVKSAARDYNDLANHPLSYK